MLMRKRFFQLKWKVLLLRYLLGGIVVFNKFGGKLRDDLRTGYVCNVTECARWADVVLDKVDEFVNRGIFYTLGGGAYIDTPEEYRTRVNDQDRVLGEFQGLRDKMMLVMGQMLNTEVKQLDNAGYPGFHIVGSGASGRSGMFHVDMPYQHVYWPGPFCNPFTFTLLLRTPVCGSALWHWDDINFDEAMKIIVDTRNPLHASTISEMPTIGRETIEYDVGALYVHSGRVPHAIADMGEIGEGEYRVTLQGHGAYLIEEGCAAVYF